MSITSWPSSERPRERLLEQGASALSDAELLAIFLRTGVKGCSAVDLAKNLLEEFGSLNGLFSAPQKRICSAKGLGPAKYAQLQAVLEMALRHLREELSHGPILSSSQAVRQYVQRTLRNQPREIFAAMFLNTQNELLSYEHLFEGTLAHTAVHPREVIRRALELGASAIIVAHNHPSGAAEPSHADKAITEHLKQALNLVDIRLLDHFVVAGNQITSFAEAGLL